MPSFFPENNSLRASDARWRLLQKWCSVLYDRVGDHGPTYYPEGSRPLSDDTRYRLLTKIEAMRNFGSPGIDTSVSPLTYPGILAWWDATELAYADGQVLDATTHKFTDQTGNGFNGSLAGGGPVLKTGIINGQNVVRFNGVADFLDYNPISIPGYTGGLIAMSRSSL